ncbi:MAG: MFS transporter [Candidatus Helarchaeota archaeon]
MGEIYKSGNIRNYFLVIILIIFINLMTFEQGLIPTNVDPIQMYFGIGADFLGIFVGVYTAIMATMALIFGYLADKQERINLLILGAGIWSFCALMSYFSAILLYNVILFAIFRILAGIGLGCLMPVGFSLLTDIISSKSRSKAFAIWGIATMIGAATGAVIGADLYSTYGRTGVADLWAEPFLFIGVTGMFIIAFVVIFFREPKRAATEEVFKDLISKEGLSYSYRIKKEDLKNIYKRKSNFWLIINFVDTIYPGLLILWIFDYLSESFNLEEGLFSFELLYLFIMLLIGLLGGTVIFSWLGDRLYQKGDKSARAKIAVYCALLTNPFVLLAFIEPLSTQNYWWIGILIAVGLGVNQGIGPNWYASIIDVNLPENRGTMIATASFLDNIGRAIGQIVGGILIASFTVFVAFQWATIFLFLQIPFWIPVLIYIKRDLQEVEDILAKRAKEMAAQLEHTREES